MATEENAGPHKGLGFTLCMHSDIFVLTKPMFYFHHYSIMSIVSICNLEAFSVQPKKIRVRVFRIWRLRLFLDLMINSLVCSAMIFYHCINQYALQTNELIISKKSWSPNSAHAEDFFCWIEKLPNCGLEPYS